MFKTEIREAIRAAHDRPQRRRGTSQHCAPAQSDGRDGVRTGDGEPADPNDEIDPDDLTKTEPVRCVLLLPPPTQSESWWIAVVLGRESDVVAPQDVFSALAAVAYRLGYTRAGIGNPITESGTVGQLHEAIEEHYGKPGWTALVECWRTAAGIEQPVQRTAAACAKNNHGIAASQCSEQNVDGKPDSAEQPVTRQGFTSQARVMRWFERPEPVPPAWRHQETAGEKEWRESLDSCGSWCG